MKKFLFVIIIAFTSGITYTFGQKTAKPVKLSTLVKAANLAIKNNKQQNGAENVRLAALNDAENKLLAALPRTDLSEKEKASIYLIAAQIEESKNSIENRKAYLKQKYDTVIFFSTLYNMYEHLRHCDSIDAQPYNDCINPKYDKKTRALRQKYRQNILNGGKFFLNKKQYEVSYQYLDAFCTYSGFQPTDTIILFTSYSACLCGYLTSHHDWTLKYVENAIKAALPEQKPILLEYKFWTYYLLKDEESALRELQRGVREYPSHDYFFVNLIDNYFSERKFDEGLALTDSLIQLDSTKPLYWYTKCKLELAENDYHKCIEFADSTIIRDSEYVDAYYNKGISFLNLALIEQESACRDIGDPKCMEDRKRFMNLYEQSRTCMEMVRKLQPEKTERWANPLYRIYMNLNMGEEFEEIDKVLHPKK